MATISNVSQFSPTQISGCSLWLDAADRNSITLNGNNVSQWNDKSGNGYHAVPSTGSGGTYPSNSINGFATVGMTTTGNMYAPVPAQTFPNQLSAFVVFMKTGTNAKDTVIYRSQSVNADTLGSPFLAYTSTRVIGNGTTFAYNTAATNPFSNVVPTLYNFNISSNANTTWNEWINGSGFTYTLSAGTPGYNDTSTRVWLGAGTNVANPTMAGVIAEVIMYNITPSTAQRQQVEGYLAWKWNLQANLPSTHPYYNNPMIPNLRLSAPLANPLTTSNTTLITMNPTQISGCALWLDAADPTTVTLTGSNVTNVRDKSGQNVILSNATGFSYSNVFNGSLPSFFNPNGGRIGTNTTATLGVNALFGVTVPFTIFFAGLETATSGNYGYVCDSGPSGLNRPYILASNIQTSFGAGGGVSPVQRPFQACAQFYTSGGAMIVNGSNYYTQTIGLSAFTTGGITVGNRYSLTESWPGHLCEIIIYNKPVPTLERQQIEGYLAWKWGLQANLPTSHPYFYNPLIPNLILPSQIYTISPSFSPSRFSGLSLWLDAADSSSVGLSGNSVTQWNDKSGNGYNALSNSNYTGTFLPTYSSNTANKYVQMIDNQALCTSIYNYTTAWSCFVCMNTVSLTTNRWLISPYSYVNVVMMGMNYGNNKIFNTAFTTSPVDITGNHIEYTSAENTNAISNLLYYRDGTIQASNVKSLTTAANASAKMGIGANANLASSQTGTYQVYEIVIYNTALSTNQRQQIEGYLAWKWGLQSNLPANHPYVLFPPN